MATGGTGDILTGMVAGMIAQHPDQPMVATAGAVYLHGLAGDRVRTDSNEQWMTATDLLLGLKDAIGWAAREAKDKSSSWAGRESISFD